jgi:flagellar biosynthetic protein FliR
MATEGMAIEGMDFLAQNAFAFMLLFCRTGAALMSAPGWGEADLPAQVRLGFALAFTLLLLPGIAPTLPAPSGIGQAFGLVAVETVAGLLLGTAAKLFALSLPVAGQLAALSLGISNAIVFDPALAGQGGVLSRLFGLLAAVLVFATDLWLLPLAALVGSYRVLPAGLAFPAGDAAQLILGAVAGGFLLSVQLAAPFIIAALVFNGALGLLARLVPQLQVFFVALPIQVLGGLALLALLLSGIAAAWISAARTAITATLPGL